MMDSEFDTGAIRSTDANELRFDLIHPIALIALARTCAEGATKYGDFNWERGMPVHDLLNHALRHIYLYLAGDRTEPHLPHALWGLHAAVVSEILWPELNQAHLRGAGCTLTRQMMDRQYETESDRKEARNAGLFNKLGDWNTVDVKEVQRIWCQRAEQQMPF